MSLQLSPQTWQHLANHPRERELVTAICDRLQQLDTTTGTNAHGPDIDRGLVAALQFVLAHHQPTRRRRCRACRRITARHLWRRRHWLCVVWRQAHYELIGPFAGSGHHRQN